MKLTRSKIGKMSPIVMAILMGGFWVGNSFSEPVPEQRSAFDMLLPGEKQTTAASVEGQGDGTDHREQTASVQKIDEPVDSKENGQADKIQAEKAGQHKTSNESAIRPRLQPPTQPQSIESVWTATVPNRKNPEAEKPIDQIADRRSISIGNNETDQLAVESKNPLIRQSNEKPEEAALSTEKTFAVWDAVPVTVRSGDFSENESENGVSQGRAAKEPLKLAARETVRESKPSVGSTSDADLDAKTAEESDSVSEEQETDDATDPAKEPLIHVADEENGREIGQSEEKSVTETIQEGSEMPVDSEQSAGNQEKEKDGKPGKKVGNAKNKEKQAFSELKAERLPVEKATDRSNTEADEVAEKTSEDSKEEGKKEAVVKKEADDSTSKKDSVSEQADDRADDDSQKTDDNSPQNKSSQRGAAPEKAETGDSKFDGKTSAGSSGDDVASMLKALEQKNIEEKARENLEGQTEKQAEEREIAPAESSEATRDDLRSQLPPEPALPDFDDDMDDDNRPRLVDGNRVGDSYAKDKIKLMYDEIVNGLKTRGMSGRYEMWKNYARSTLRGTAGLNTGSEVDGRCRLSWYTQLYREPVFSVFAVEEFSRQLHHGLSGSHRHLAEVLSMIRKKLDVPGRNDQGIGFPKCETPMDAINEVKRCLLEAQMAHARALSTLGSAEQKELSMNLVATFSGSGAVNGHTIPNRTYGRKLVNILETVDKSAMHAAADALLPLTNKALLALLDQLPEDAFPTSYVGGQQVQRIMTSAGDIIIGGRGNNIYDLDSPEMRDVACVIDLGGNDMYRDGVCDLDRPVLVVVDLHGNDSYVGSKPGIQGGSVLGVSLLVDCEGNDNYTASDVAQGSSIGGIGILLDFDGDDHYRGLRRCQGHALCGVGVLNDYAGDDKYRAALWAQGFGAPGGFGVLNDIRGNDHYYCGGLYLDSYPEHPGYDGWGQGIGAGIRQVANGGIGAFLDGDGDDVYEVDYFGHGGGYWLGVGFARDFGGNDVRHGTTLNAYNGGPRTQNRWTRFANGFGCHYSLGYCFDDAGDDVYGGTIMGTGMAWDLSIGFLCDFNGSDRFTATGGMTQGVGAEGSIGILFCYGGDDTFLGRNQAYAGSGITYHSPANCGSNFSFLINYGGKNQYGCGAKSSSYVQRGSAGGYLIDRPTIEEEAAEVARLKKLVAERQKEIADWEAEQERLKEEAAENKRRYVQRTRRPQPLNIDLQRRISAVPSFEKNPPRTLNNANTDVNVK